MNGLARTRWQTSGGFPMLAGGQQSVPAGHGLLPTAHEQQPARSSDYGVAVGRGRLAYCPLAKSDRVAARRRRRNSGNRGLR